LLDSVFSMLGISKASLQIYKAELVCFVRVDLVFLLMGSLNLIDGSAHGSFPFADAGDELRIIDFSLSWRVAHVIEI